MAGKATIFTGAYVLGIYFLLLLVRISQGALNVPYMNIALVVATSTVLWILFTDLPTFHFSPVIKPFTAFLLMGIVLFLLAIVFLTMQSDETRSPRISSRTPTFMSFRYELPRDNGQQSGMPVLKTSSSSSLLPPSSSKEQEKTGMKRVRSAPALLSF